MTTATQTATDNLNLDQTDGAIVEVKPDNALVVLNPQKYAEELFAPYGAQLTQAKRRASKATYDVATNEGKAALRLIIRSFVTIRTSSDKAKTEAKRPIDQAGKAILAVVAPIAAACKTEEEKYQAILDAQLQAEEAEKQRKIEAERVRVEQIENRIAHIKAITTQLAQANSELVAAKLQELVDKRLDPDMYDEYLEDAVRTLNGTIDELRIVHAAALDREAAARQAEADRQELLRLKAEQAERERLEAEAAAARIAQAQREREAQEAAARQLAEQQAEMARHRAQMDEVLAIQNLAMVTGDYATVDAALAQAVNFQPDAYGSMAPMARMARNMALDALNARIATIEKPTTAIPVAAPAPTLEQELAPSMSAIASGLGIDWNEPAPLADQFLTPSPVETPRVDDSKQVEALLNALRDLYALETRAASVILLLVSDELNVLEAGEGK